MQPARAVDHRYSSRMAALACLWAAALLWPAHGANAADAEPPGHAAYLETLKEFGVPPSSAGAIEYLRQLHPSPERRQEVAALIEALADRSFARRESAMQSLLRMPNPPLAQLSAAADGDDPEVRWRAREILNKSQGQSTRVILAAMKVIAAEPTDDAVGAVLEAVPLCHQPFLEAAAIDALRATARPQHMRELRAALAGGQPSQRIAAAAALCRVVPKEERETIYPLLDDRDGRVVLEVARALADVGDRRCLAALVGLLAAEENGLRTDAALTLRGLTGQYMGYAPYETPQQRHEAIKKWSTWIANDGATAKLTFPVPRHSSARGDLGGHTLVSTGSKGRVRQFDAQGKEVWSYPIAAWSAEKLQNGNVLIGSYNGNKVLEVEPATDKVVWQYPGINAMTAKPLPGGNILVADFNGRRVVEIGRNKQIVWEHKTEQECFDCDRLPNGNTIFGCPNFVREVTHDHKLIREWKIDGRLNGFQALPSGNILVANYGRSEVVELSPDGRRVWEFKEQRPCDVFRLPGGNTLISSYRRIIEIGPDDKLIREICDAQYGSARK